MSKKERKIEYKDYHEGFEFTTCNDLSQGIKVKGDTSQTHKLAEAIMCFTADWMYWVKPRLNGFQGFGSVRFEFEVV